MWTDQDNALCRRLHRVTVFWGTILITDCWTSVALPVTKAIVCKTHLDMNAWKKFYVLEYISTPDVTSRLCLKIHVNAEHDICLSCWITYKTKYVHCRCRAGWINRRTNELPNIKINLKVARYKWSRSIVIYILNLLSGYGRLAARCQLRSFWGWQHSFRSTKMDSLAPALNLYF